MPSSGNGSTDGDSPPQSPLFANAPGASPSSIGKVPWTPDEQKRIDELRALIAEGKLGRGQDANERGRAQRFLPYLLVRSFTGDNGTRPISVCFWESPDIWTADGDPSATPEIPGSHGGTVTAGRPSTVYAHVWNLGRAPLAGIVVEFYWFNPSLSIDGAYAHLIGMTRVELGPRSSPLCHKLVKCPVAWVPVMENGGHECLVVRVWGFGDAIGADEWNSWENRHVAQRNISVVQTPAQMEMIINTFSLQTLTVGSRVEMLQVGVEGSDAVKIVAPSFRLDPAILTRTLAQLDGDRTMTVIPTDNATPRVLTNALVSATVAGQPSGMRKMPITPTKLTLSNANVGTLVGHSALFNTELLKAIQGAPPPAKGQAHVMRIAQYAGNQITGGYTIVIKGVG